MGLRFRQSFQLFPGVRINVSGSGVSATFGVPGASVNLGPGGVRSTVGLPGTGLSYSHHHCGSEGPAPGTPQPLAPQTPNYALQQFFRMREINSAAVEDLSSHSLVKLRDMIVQARSQRKEIAADLAEAQTLYQNDSADLERRQRSLFRIFYKRRIAELEHSVPQTEAEIQRLTQWQANTHIDMQFETSEAAHKAWGHLVRTFEALRGSVRIWDITSDRDVHRVIERSAASRNIDRKPVKLEFSSSDLIQFDGRAMRFGNANGEDILIYPGMVVMPRADGAFALIDLREVQLAFELQNFIEHEQVPSDSTLVGETWAKVNKNGTPDLRFKDNYRIPIALYGKMLFTSAGGVEEEYQFSNAEAAKEFARAFEGYKSALAK